MKRGWILVLLLSMFALAPAGGCRVDADDDDDLDVKVDTEGRNKGLKVDTD
jgi:hypothetical protein